MTDKQVSEYQKYELEEKKLKLLYKNFWVDLLGKIGLPLAVLVLSWVTYIGNKEQTEARLSFDRDAKNKELAQKDQDIFLKEGDLARAHDAEIRDFMQKNISLVLSNSIDDRKKLTSLIEIAFKSIDDQKYLISQISQIKQTTENTVESESIKGESDYKNYREIGLGFVNKNDWENAVSSFETAIFFSPKDAELWNFKAYCEMRAGRLDAAYQSISTATGLPYNNSRTKTLIAVNATKILCAQNKFQEASSYIKSVISVFPEITTTLAKDVEFRSKCSSISVQ